MNLTIPHKNDYSRAEALLRGLLGVFYIGVPHLLAMFFVAVWSLVLLIAAWWVILFTGRHPRNWFDFQVNFLGWRTRVVASLLHLVEGYPQFGMAGEHSGVEVSIEYPESLDRKLLLLKTFLGLFYIILPHGLCLFFRLYATLFLAFLSWCSILFTGRQPQQWHEFNVGTLRWALRFAAYILNLSDQYPRFSGRP